MSSEGEIRGKLGLLPVILKTELIAPVAFVVFPRPNDKRRSGTLPTRPTAEAGPQMCRKLKCQPRRHSNVHPASESVFLHQQQLVLQGHSKLQHKCHLVEIVLVPRGQGAKWRVLRRIEPARRDVFCRGAAAGQHLASGTRRSGI